MSFFSVSTMQGLLLLIALDIILSWIAMGLFMALILWAALNFARICEWMLNIVTRKTS
jgi:hypothetical protein